MKTQQQHIADDAGSCPVCGSEETEGRFTETGAGVASQQIDCLACGSSWIDYYTLSGFGIVEEGTPKTGTSSLDN